MKKSNRVKPLPPGQFELTEFPRFGLSPYAKRYRQDFGKVNLNISGMVKQTFSLTHHELAKLTQYEVKYDFHCVTTWTKRNLCWRGYRFIDFFEQLIKPQLDLDESVHWVVFKSIDGYRARMLLTDVLNSSVLLADGLDGKPLCSKHGAPLRLIAPEHYGYKNPKHLKSIEFHTKNYCFKPPLLSFMEHPRGRVSEEERGQFFPGWMLRYFYRPLIKSTIRKFKSGMLTPVKPDELV